MKLPSSISKLKNSQSNDSFTNEHSVGNQAQSTAAKSSIQSPIGSKPSIPIPVTIPAPVSTSTSTPTPTPSIHYPPASASTSTPTPTPTPSIHYPPVSHSRPDSTLISSQSPYLPSPLTSLCGSSRSNSLSQLSTSISSSKSHSSPLEHAGMPNTTLGVSCISNEPADFNELNTTQNAVVPTIPAIPAPTPVHTPIPVPISAPPVSHSASKMVFNEKDCLYYCGVHSKHGLDGEGCVLTETRSVLREGTFKHNKLHGKGKDYYPREMIEKEYTRAGKVIPNTPVVHLEGTFVNGVLDGEGCEYTIEGKLLYKGKFVNGEYEGEGVLIDEAKGIKMIGTFAAGQLHGKGKVTTLDDELCHEGTYVNGLLHGHGVEYNWNGGISYEGDFQEGERRGRGKMYDEMGRLVYDGGIIGDCWTGNGTFYDYDRDLLFEGSLVDNFLTGLGKISILSRKAVYQEGMFEHNKLVKGKEYNPETGLLLRDGETDYQNNSFKGKIYDEQGHLQMETTVVNNSPEGLTIFYYPTNPPVKQREGMMKNGQFEGEVMEYLEDGSLSYKTTYVNGVEHGLREEYLGDICLFRCTMDHGHKKGEATEYDINGRIQFKGVYAKDAPWEGTETLYVSMETEQVCFHRTWKEGKLSPSLMIYGKESAEPCSIDNSWRCVYNGGWIEDDMNGLGNENDLEMDSFIPLRHGDGIVYLEDGQQLYLKWDHDIPDTSMCTVRRTKAEGTKWKDSIYKGPVEFDSIMSFLHPEFCLHGNGYFYYQDNSFFVGQWNKGTLVATQNVIYWSDKTVKYQTTIKQFPADGQYPHEFLPSGPTRFFPKTWRGIVEGTFAPTFNCLDSQIKLYSMTNELLVGPMTAQYSMNADGYNVDYGYPRF